MRNLRCRRSVFNATLIFLLLFPFHVHAEWSVTAGAVSGEPIILTSPLDTIPPSGMWPLELNITNRSPYSKRYRLSVEITGGDYHQSAEASFIQDIKVEGNQSKKTQFLAPIPNKMKSTELSQVHNLPYARVSLWQGADILLSDSIRFDSRSSGVPSLYTVVTEAWVQVGRGALSDYFDKKKTPFYGSLISKVNNLPGDWRGYSGVALLFLTSREWSQLTLQQSDAIQSWIRLGGTLFTDLSSPTELDRIRPKRCTGEICNIGFGTLIMVKNPSLSTVWNASERSISKVLKLREWDGVDLYSKTPNIQISSSVLAEKIESYFVLQCIVLLYALLVGPFNILYLTLKKKLLLVYLTTPILSFIASCITIGGILMRDGIGGSGERWIQVFLDGESNTEFIQQKQVVKTGVLLGKKHNISDEVLIDRIDQGATGGYGSGPSKNFQIELSQGVYTGDWIESNSRTEHQLNFIRSTRATLEIHSQTSSGIPVLISRMSGPLALVFVHTSDGQLWYGENVQQGVASQLLPLKDKSSYEQLIDRSLPMGEVTGYLNRSWRGLTSRQDSFVAFVKDSTSYVIPSFSAISWNDHPALIFGDLS